jgi:hypothetical protein
VNFVVNPTAAIKDFTLTPDAKVIKAGTNYKIWIDAVDTYGVAVKPETLATQDTSFSIFSTVPTVADKAADAIKYDATAKRAYIDLVPEEKGNTSLVVTHIPTGKSFTLPIVVNEASEIVGMTLDKSSITFAASGSTTLKATFVDQYGDKVTDLTGYTATIKASVNGVVNYNTTTPTPVNLIDGATITAEAVPAFNSATLTVELKDITPTTPVLVDSKTVSISVIPANTALTYEVSDITKLYGQATPSAFGAEYNGAVKVTAKNSAGTTVYIPSTAIVSVTTSNANLLGVVKHATNGSYQVFGLTAGITTGTEASAVVTVVIENYDGTVSIVTKSVTVSKDVPAVQSVKVFETSAKTTELAEVTNSFFVEALDQYGVNIAGKTGVLSFVVTNKVPTGAAISAAVDSTGLVTVTAPAGSTANITIVTSNGLTKTVKGTF